MKILAVVPDDARVSLEKSLTGTQRLSRGGGADAVALSLRERKCDALVLDPGELDSDEFETVMDAVDESGVPMLLYARLDAHVARRIVLAVDGAAHELVVRDAEDAPELLRQKIAALAIPSVPALLLQRAAPHFRDFPDSLATTAVSLFGRSTLPRWVSGLVEESGFARRTVDRWMKRGGITGAARLLDAARLARVWEPLVERGMSLADVVDHCGYERLRLFTAHTRRLLATEPRALPLRFTRESFSARLGDVLVTRPSDDGAAPVKRAAPPRRLR